MNDDNLPEESLFQEKIILQQKFQNFLDNKEFEDKTNQITNEIKNILRFNYSNYGFSAIAFLLEILDSFLIEERKILIKLLRDFVNDVSEIKELSIFLDEKFSNLFSPEIHSKDEIIDEISDDSDEFDSELSQILVRDEDEDKEKSIYKSELPPSPESSITNLGGAEPISTTDSKPSPKPSMPAPGRFEPEEEPSPPPPPMAIESSFKKSDTFGEAPAKPSMSDSKKKKKGANLSAKRSRSLESLDFAKESADEYGSMDGGISEEEKTVQLERFLLVDYFKQMNPNSVYAFHITVSKKELKVKKTVSDVLTGETREQVTEKFELVSESPVIVDVSFPGCLTTPLSQKISAFDDKTIISFFVTPLAKGSMKGTIKLLQDDKIIFKMDLKYKVADQRISKIVSAFGLTFAALPTILNMVFGIDPNEQIVSYLTTSLPNTDLSNIAPGLLLAELGIGILLLFIAGLLFFKYKGKRDSLSSESF